MYLARSERNGDVPSIDLGSLQPCAKPMVTNLGVKIDSAFKLNKQINSVVKSSFYHLRLLSKINPVLSVA